MQKYKVSISSFYKILNKRKQLESWKESQFDENNFKSKLSKAEQNFIRNYVIPPKPPLTIEKINNEMNSIFAMKNRKREIKAYLKKQIKVFI